MLLTRIEPICDRSDDNYVPASVSIQNTKDDVALYDIKNNTVTFGHAQGMFDNLATNKSALQQTIINEIRNSIQKTCRAVQLVNIDD